MSSVTFPPALGGDGSTVTDDSNVSTGLANGGHRTRFVPALAQMVAVANGGVTQATAQVAAATTQANNALSSANAAAASAASAVNSPGTNATSTSSVLIGTGSKSLTVQTGKLFVVGQPVMIARTSAPGTTWMAGNVTSYDSGTGALVVNVVWTAGSGTFTDWTVSLAGPANPAAVNKAGDSMTGDLTVPRLIATTRISGPYGYQTPILVTGNVSATLGVPHLITAAAIITLPASPVAGDLLPFRKKTASGIAVSFARNGQPIETLAEDLNLDGPNDSGALLYVDATRGWAVFRA